MEFRILDSNFIDRVLLDRYESLLWVDRYNEPGDFELYTPPTETLLKYCQIGNYIYSKDSEHLMLIEYVQLATNFEDGARIIIKGRSIECLLERRILWYKTQFRKNLEDAIRQILMYSFIDPTNQYFVDQGMYTDLDRKVDNFIFEYSGDPSINKFIVDSEYDIGTDLLTVIQELCKSVNLGFKITLNSQNQFVFKLYNGANRSYNQTKNPWVVFSNKYENLITNDFASDSTKYRNVVRTFAQRNEDEEPHDFLTFESQRQNILITESEDTQIVDYEPFAFTIGKLKIGEKYSFTSKVFINEGTMDSITLELTSQDPYRRIYATSNVKIQNGRITTSLVVEQPDEYYDDCYILLVYAGIKGSSSENVITLNNPIFTHTDKDFKASGFNRIEVFNDASSIEYTEEMTEDEYISQLQESAYETLDADIVQTTVNGTVEDRVPYEYRKDYNIGDIVQVENEFGILGTMRVVEFITSHSTSGIEMYPTFKTNGGDNQ